MAGGGDCFSGGGAFLKDFFHSNGFKAFLGILFILLGLMLYTASSGGAGLPDVLGSFFTPMQKVTAVITNNAADSVGRPAADLEKENRELKKEIDSLNNKLIDYYQVKQENEQYRTYLQLKKDNNDFTFVSGSVVGRDPNDLFYSFTVDKGSLAGVRLNSPVITNSGVVGWVSSVGSSFCKVTTVLSADTGIAAIDKANRESGVISSNIKLADKGLVKLSFLAAGTTVKKGDIVVTSGLGGVYPKDLPIGKVQDVGPEEYDVSYGATVAPFVDVKTVRDVFIITGFLGQGEVLGDLPGGSSSSRASSSSPAQGSEASK
jgi:rod shape-determining protein MreC